MSKKLLLKTQQTENLKQHKIIHHYSCWVAVVLNMFFFLGGTDCNTRTWAQVKADGTLSTTVNSQNQRDFRVTGGNRAGANLFHSFRTFSVPNGGSATFDQPSDIQNIFSRVTGSSVSNINGLIRVSGTANLFLINPNGILFGPNARLDIRGSFIATTANQLKFLDGPSFSTNPRTAPLLSVSVPIGLQYGQGSANQITVQGSMLSMPLDQALVLAGGELRLSQANLQTDRGSIDLVAISEGGQVGLQTSPQGIRLSLPAAGHRANITVQNHSLVSTSGNQGSGDILIAGQQVAVRDSRIETNTRGAGTGGDLNVNASETISITSQSNQGTFSDGLFAETLGDGDAGNLRLQTNNLRVQGAARISAATFGTGDGGNLQINAANQIELIGVDPPADGDFRLFTGLLTDTEATGRAGNLTLNARRLIVRDGAQISTATFGAGDGGNLTVNVKDSIHLSGGSPSDSLGSGLFSAAQASSSPEARAGNLTVTTRQLELRQGAQIATGTVGRGDGGDLSIQADNIEISGTSPSGFNSGLLSTSDDLQVAKQGTTTGRAGNLTIQTDRLSIRDGGQVAAAIFGNTSGGGNLQITAHEFIEVSGAAPSNSLGGDTGIFAGTPLAIPTTGNAGNITLNTPSLIVSDRARIGVSHLGTGNAGQLVVNADSINLRQQAGLTAATASGKGGNIQLNARDTIALRQGSLISAEASGNSNGGNITAVTQLMTVLGNSNIIANAFEGRGGNIQISAEGLLVDRTSTITASSQFGVDGEVQITTPAVDLTQGLAILPTEPVNTATLIQQGCRSASSARNEFVITGRGGLPPTPLGVLDTNVMTEDLGNLEAPSARSESARSESLVQSPAPQSLSSSEALIEAQGWITNEQGQISLVAYHSDSLRNTLLNVAECHQGS